MIKAIIFDLGGVIFTDGTNRFVANLVEKYGVDEDKARNIIEGKIGTQYRKSEITRNEFWKRFLEELAINENADKLEEAWISEYKLRDEMRDLLFELAKKYKLYFLSDSVRERAERLNSKYNLVSWFTDGIFSHEVGIRKPHPDMYRLILEKAGVKPEEAIFTDDKEKFLEPARELGMKTIHFETTEKFRDTLEKLLNP